MKIAVTILAIFLAHLSIGKNINIQQLSGNCYVYTTYKLYHDSWIATNGTYLVTNEGVVLMDTPWDTSDFQPLLDSIENRHHKKVVLCIATHFHADRTAGLHYYTSKGIKTYTSFHTDSLSKVHGESLAAFHFRNDTTFTLGGETVQIHYPGKGHSPDNIVAWFPNQKVLHGGCFVKSGGAGDLGNLSDAVTDAWEISITNTIQKFKDAGYVIAGHDNWRSKNPLQRTLKLLKKHNREK